MKNSNFVFEVFAFGVFVYVCISYSELSDSCDLMDYSPPGFFVHRVPQAKILGWIVISSSRGSSQLRDRTRISCGSCIADRFFTTEPLGNMGDLAESDGEGNGAPLQYSRLESPMDGGAW